MSLRVFIGYDPNEPVAYHVLCHSILRRSRPLSIMPIVLERMQMWRARDQLQSTEFSFSRFLVPYLCGYRGYALFMDCDMLALADLQEVMAYADSRYAVSVCKHDYVPSEERKFLEQPQTPYRRKNWSSFMLFNCAGLRNLTPDYVNSASGLELHQFGWCPDEAIGALPLGWNHLVGEPGQSGDIKVLHWTNGGPWFPAYAAADHAELWREEYRAMTWATPTGAYRKREPQAA